MKNYRIIKYVDEFNKTLFKIERSFRINIFKTKWSELYHNFYAFDYDYGGGEYNFKYKMFEFKTLSFAKYNLDLYLEFLKLDKIKYRGFKFKPIICRIYNHDDWDGEVIQIIYICTKLYSIRRDKKQYVRFENLKDIKEYVDAYLNKIKLNNTVLYER